MSPCRRSRPDRPAQASRWQEIGGPGDAPTRTADVLGQPSTQGSRRAASPGQQQLHPCSCRVRGAWPPGVPESTHVRASERRELPHALEAGRQRRNDRAGDLHREVLPSALDAVAVVLVGDVQAADDRMLVTPQQLPVVTEAQAQQSLRVEPADFAAGMHEGIEIVAGRSSDPKESTRTRTCTPRLAASTRQVRKRSPTASGW